MPNKSPGEGCPESLSYDYLYDGHIRRQFHELGVSGFNFYSETLRLLDFRPGQIVAEIGAGMGNDALTIASTYNPKLTYMVEPKSAHPELFDRFYPLSLEIERIPDVVLLPPLTEDDLRKRHPFPDVTQLSPQTAYLQHIESYAEELPFEDDSIDRLTMIHSAYEFSDLDKALEEARRVMAPGAVGGLVTNGPDDKKIFKEILQNMKEKLGQEAPEEITYQAPDTVSSRLDYFAARKALQKHFKSVHLFTYQDRARIDAQRGEPVYITSFDSYRHKFYPAIINDGRWIRSRRAVLDSRIEHERSRYGDFYDYIDIGLVLFANPR